MKIKILVPQEIEIEDNFVQHLVDTTRKRWGQRMTEPVFPADMLAQAVIEQIIPELPEGFVMDDQWADAMTDAEWEECLEPVEEGGNQ